jgi:cysteinyl-tRNA synthetase
MDKGKMSKSSGEFITLKSIRERGFDPLAYRFLCLGAHYRKQLMFSWEAMEGASQGYKALKKKIIELKKGDVTSGDTAREEFYKNEFRLRINDDLNIPQSLALLNDMLKDDKLGNIEKLKLIGEFDRILGLDLLKEEEVGIPDDILSLVKEREKAREEKNYELSDKYRDEIKKRGYVVKDTKSGPEVDKI